MTRVKITGLDKEVKDLRSRVLDAVEQSNFENVLAREVRAKIRKDGIEPDLATSTKRYRNQVVSRKGPGYFVGKSSLTLSGQLLGSMVSVFQRKMSAFYFGVKNGAHKGYRYRKKNGKVSRHNQGTSLIDIWDGLMKDRPVTKVFDDRDFKVGIERRLVSAIKRFFK